MSLPESIELTAVVGSVTAPGRLRRAVDEALTRAHGAHTELIDLAERWIAFADGRRGRCGSGGRSARRRLPPAL